MWVSSKEEAYRKKGPIQLLLQNIRGKICTPKRSKASSQLTCHLDYGYSSSDWCARPVPAYRDYQGTLFLNPDKRMKIALKGLLSSGVCVTSIRTAEVSAVEQCSLNKSLF